MFELESEPLRTGHLVITPAVLALNLDAYLFECLARHRAGNGGLISDADAAANRDAAARGGRILSIYPLHPGTSDGFNDSSLGILTETTTGKTTLMLVMTPLPHRSILFRAGMVEIAEDVLAMVSAEYVMPRLKAHLTGDWGRVSESTAKNNRENLRTGGAILSHYELPGTDSGVWIRTHENRTRVALSRRALLEDTPESPPEAPASPQGAPRGAPTANPVPEITSELKPRQCPPYELVGKYIGEVSDLVGDLSFHGGTAMAYVWRAGRKPGNPAAEDLRKAADHCLLEAERLEKLAHRQET